MNVEYTTQPSSRSRLFAIVLYGVIATVTASQSPAADGHKLVVVSPPDSFFALVRERDRDAARHFYRKYLDIGGIPVVAASEVADLALVRTHEIVTHMLAGRVDVVAAMKEQGMYLIIIGKDQVYTDMPEYRGHPNPTYQNERVRGTGGRPTSFGEENLLSLPLDRYDDESIGVHEFSHTIDGALRSIDPDWSERRNGVFQAARRQGLYENTYAGSSAGEYWAEVCQAYFDCNRVNNWNHGPIGTRDQLRAYDPAGYELARSTFRLTPEQNWRYRFLQPHPAVIPPPARFAIDSYYTKFTWAREFPIVSRSASDQSLLAANDRVRKLFAYRHDILKALIADGVKLVVLGPHERLADLPEIKALPDRSSLDLLSRSLNYNDAAKLLVVAEENVTTDVRQPGVGESQLIRVLAGAIQKVAGERPVDEQWDSRPRGIWQQYELGLKRIDERFNRRLSELHTAACSAGKWKGTSAIHDPASYWIAGVLAYFDAKGQERPPLGSEQPVVSREVLKQYDEGLYALVHETFAYGSKVDWRLAR
jgi:alpha-glucosidase